MGKTTVLLAKQSVPRLPVAIGNNVHAGISQPHVVAHTPSSTNHDDDDETSNEN
jgi:hypothetical protein